MTIILLISIGFASGIISGMGIGGGTILIPALTLLAAINQHQSQNINLIFFIPTAIIALITHFKEKNIETKILLKIILFGIIGAIIGSCIAVRIDSTILKKMFGGFLLIMGAIEFFKKGETQKSKV